MTENVAQRDVRAPAWAALAPSRSSHGTGAALSVLFVTPMVVTLHGSDMLRGRLQPLLSRLISAIADAAIAVSPAIAERCHGALIPCGVDLERFRPIDRAQARSRLGLAPDLQYVLFPFD